MQLMPEITGVGKFIQLIQKENLFNYSLVYLRDKALTIQNEKTKTLYKCTRVD